jgi:hypothetical protein
MQSETAVRTQASQTGWPPSAVIKEPLIVANVTLGCALQFSWQDERQ